MRVRLSRGKQHLAKYNFENPQWRKVNEMQPMGRRRVCAERLPQTGCGNPPTHLPTYLPTYLPSGKQQLAKNYWHTINSTQNFTLQQNEHCKLNILQYTLILTMHCITGYGGSNSCQTGNNGQEYAQAPAWHIGINICPTPLPSSSSYSTQQM